MLRLLYGRNALPHRCKIKSFLNKEIKCSRRETTIKSKKRMMQQNHEANEDLNRYTGYKMSGLCISIPTIRSTSFNSSNRNINTLQRNYYPKPRCSKKSLLRLSLLSSVGGPAPSASPAPRGCPGTRDRSSRSRNWRSIRSGPARTVRQPRRRRSPRRASRRRVGIPFSCFCREASCPCFFSPVGVPECCSRGRPLRLWKGGASGAGGAAAAGVYDRMSAASEKRGKVRGGRSVFKYVRPSLSYRRPSPATAPAPRQKSARP